MPRLSLHQPGVISLQHGKTRSDAFPYGDTGLMKRIKRSIPAAGWAQLPRGVCGDCLQWLLLDAMIRSSVVSFQSRPCVTSVIIAQLVDLQITQ